MRRQVGNKNSTFLAMGCFRVFINLYLIHFCTLVSHKMFCRSSFAPPSPASPGGGDCRELPPPSLPPLSYVDGVKQASKFIKQTGQLYS